MSLLFFVSYKTILLLVVFLSPHHFFDYYMFLNKNAFQSLGKWASLIRTANKISWADTEASDFKYNDRQINWNPQESHPAINQPHV